MSSRRFTNPNNLSIVTGVPPSVHGICGNYFWIDATAAAGSDDERPEVPRRAGRCWPLSPKTVPRRGGDRKRQTAPPARLADLTGICFSAEKADEVTIEENGIDELLELVGKPVPSVYSAELSEFVFAAGVRLARNPRNST